MLNEMKVVGVKFREVDQIAFEMAIKDYVRNSTEFKAVEKDGKLYVIKNGKSFELTADSLNGQIEKGLVGSNILEVNRKSDLLNLAKSSGILVGLTLELEDEDEIELF